MSDTLPGRPRRLVARIGLTLAVIAGPVLFAAVAGAGVTTFSLSPASGPAGTIVSVSGSGCSPGLFVSAVADYLQVAISTVPPTSAHLPLAANGTWQGTLTIPANAASAAAAVTATCVSDNPQSLLTIYLPKTFTVTAATPTSPPTTAAPTTAPPTTPTTGPGGATTHRTTTTVGPARGTTPGSPSPTTPSPGGANPKGPTGGAHGPGTVAPPDRAGGSSHRASTQSRTADLDAPALSLTDDGGGSPGLEWFFWLVLLASLAGAGFVGWWYRTRRRLDTNEEGP